MNINGLTKFNLTNRLESILESGSTLKKIAAVVAYPFALLADLFCFLPRLMIDRIYTPDPRSAPPKEAKAEKIADPTPALTDEQRASLQQLLCALPGKEQVLPALLKVQTLFK